VLTLCACASTAPLALASADEARGSVPIPAAPANPPRPAAGPSARFLVGRPGNGVRGNLEAALALTSANVTTAGSPGAFLTLLEGCDLPTADVVLPAGSLRGSRRVGG